MCFNTKETLLQFCEREYQILPDIYIKFEPDCFDKIRKSVKNIPIELPDTTPIGKTYYPGIKYQHKYYTTGTRVYHCIEPWNF